VGKVFLGLRIRREMYIKKKVVIPTTNLFN
jgi:hypothetical protein